MLAFLYLLNHERRMYFPRWFSPFVQLAIAVGSLLFYWYFSKAITASPNLTDSMPEGYFIYILMGEVSLLWPGILLANASQRVKQFYLKRSLDNLLVLKNKASGLLIKVSLAQVLLQSLKYILYFIVILWFSKAADLAALLNFIFLQFVYAPLFLALGLFAACIVVCFGRGEKIIQLFVSASYILAGVYFPAQGFPQMVQDIFNYSPFNDLISLSRQTLSGEMSFLDMKFKLGLYFALGLVLLFMAKCLFLYLITKCDRPINHRPLIS